MIDLENNPLTIDTSLVETILVNFIEQEVHKVGFNKVILGLSGGVDSALVAALAVKALGPENVIPVLMPYKSSSENSITDALKVCEALKMTPLKVDITGPVDSYFSNFPDASNLRKGNKMARERMTTLYDLSMEYNALVIGTSNKTELLLGYGTIFGDMASAVNPLGDLFKTQVWQLAKATNLPTEVVEKAPSADLWQGQSDETELGFSYHQVDFFLYYLIDERYSKAELLEAGFESEFLEKVMRRIQINQYKRKPPVIAKISQRTIDREFRYPRDWGT